MKPAILVAEGDERLREDVKVLLCQHGFEVIEAADKATAFRFFQSKKPNLVIIGSCRRSTRDELKVVEQIRNRDAKIPLVLVMRHSSEARIIASFRAGIDDYFKIPLVGEDSEAVKNLELLMTQYSSTTYGKYAQFYLARRQTREFFSRKPNYERAVKLYRDLIQKDPAFPLITEANYRLGVALYKTGKYEDARRSFNFVLKESRETRELEGARRFLERIRAIELRKGRK